ncbi:MAG: 5'/3'-nucleotidase SurE [Oscillospiraceae bacterium]|nr:5'/3'-nucleotidase SurE [Oscillospiraceae bacterium]
MRILIVNDDGVGAKQLPALIKWCRKLGEVTTFVPKVEQSGKSHGFEIKKPFEAKQVELEPGVTVWAVDSTPADCVRLAVLGMKMEFDLVISGVNRGLNIGSDTMYSGTVGAASEAVNLGMKAIALSTPFEYYDHHAIDHLDRVFDFVKAHALLEKHNFYNINIPEDPKGIRITHQGGPYYSDDFPAVGSDLYQPMGKPVWEDKGDLSLDTDATLHGYISITPMTIDKTCRAAFEQLSGLSD